MNFITLNRENIGAEHICCAFSDKKCIESYKMKKQWLANEFDKGYVFRRLDARAKVFIEYGPAEHSWVPVTAPEWLLINCLWVSGQYKGKGYAKALLQSVVHDANSQNKAGLVTVTGTKKFHFMSDAKWLIGQGFKTVQTLPYGFSLLALKLRDDAPDVEFNQTVLSGQCEHRDGLVAYYSNRCPFAEYHLRNSLTETAAKRGIPLKIIKFENSQQAQASPSPATIFSLFFNGKFVTTDLSVCMDTRFDKIMKA